MQNISDNDWYNTSLDIEDILAGGFLIIFALIFLPLYSIVSYVMFKNDKDIIGFRYLFSASIADMMLIFNYSLWPGLTILFKSEMISPEYRHWVQMYMDWAWFSMCYHYMIIAWSRFAAIRYPNTFRLQKKVFSYGLCAACYLIALIQVLLTHFQPWYVTFYYEPKQYGMLAEDFDKYLHEGQSIFFFTFHILMMVIPICFYGCAILLLFKHRNTALINTQKPLNGALSNVEVRLIIPCVFNSIVFIVGQVFITIGTGEGKWATWTVLLLFSTNSAVNPLLLIIFSAVIRRKILNLFGYRNMTDTKYMTVPRISCSPSPPLNNDLFRLSKSTPLLTKMTLRSSEGYSWNS